MERFKVSGVPGSTVGRLESDHDNFCFENRNALLSGSKEDNEKHVRRIILNKDQVECQKGNILSSFERFYKNICGNTLLVLVQVLIKNMGSAEMSDLGRHFVTLHE